LAVLTALLAFTANADNLFIAPIWKVVFGVAGTTGNVALQKTAADRLGVVGADGVTKLQFHGDSEAISMGSASDATITRTGAGGLSYGGTGNGQLVAVKTLSEVTTIADAATSTTTIQLPANALILAVSVRVTTVIPIAATFTVTSSNPTKTWNTAAVSAAAGSTDPGTLGGVASQTTAAGVVITPNATPTGGGTGRVRVTIHYITITPPTS